MLKYQKKLTEWEIESLDNEILDGRFVSKARTFEAALTKNTLTPEEIEATDTELCELFDQLHKTENVDSDEVVQLKTQNLILSVKEQAQKSNDLKELTDLANKYKDYPEITSYIDQRAAEVTKLINEQNAEAAAKEKAEKEAEIVAKKPNEPPKTLQQTLLTKQVWDYNELRGLGIEPTGDDMVVEDVYIERQYLLRVYKVKGLVQKATA